MTIQLTTEDKRQFLRRGFTRRNFGRLATMITAGASAPEELVLDVIESLRGHGAVDVEQMDGVREDIEYQLPAELRTPAKHKTASVQ